MAGSKLGWDHQIRRRRLRGTESIDPPRGTSVERGRTQSVI